MPASHDIEPSGARSPGGPGATVVLRPGGLSDVEAVAHIWREGWADAHVGHVPPALVSARTPASFDDRAHDRLADTIVATHADARAGSGLVMGFVMIDGDQIDQLYVDRAARGGNVGGALLSAAERAVVAAGHRSAWLAVATGNTAARRFYERQGWTDEGPFMHQAPAAAGPIAVDCHRFVSPGR